MLQKFYFRFERIQVGRLQMDVLLQAFNANQIAQHSLGQFCGAVQIDFGGYLSTDPHPLIIPELRRFLRVLARRWGPASVPFFCELEPRFVPLYFAAQLDHLFVVERPASDKFTFYHRPIELATLERSAHTGIEQLGQRAGMTPAAIQHRQQTLSELLAKLFCHALQDDDDIQDN